jgi:hypothetical protein
MKKLIKYIILLSMTVGCVNGEWGTPSQEGSFNNTVNLIEFNF